MGDDVARVTNGKNTTDRMAGLFQEPKMKLTGNQMFDAMGEMLCNFATQRMNWLRSMVDPRRDYMGELGYAEELDCDDYRTAFDRNAIANRVVTLMPMETWVVPPTICEKQRADPKDGEDPEDTETPFEKAFNEICTTLNGQSWYKEQEGNPIWGYMLQADIVSGIGHYGCILLGIDDGKDLEEPVEGINDDGTVDTEKRAKRKAREAIANALAKTGQDPVTTPELDGKDEASAADKPSRKLIYIRCFDESMARILECETDQSSPRYGQPKYYSLTFLDPKLQSRSAAVTMGFEKREQKVHWSRVVHIVDNRLTSNVLGTPRMQMVFDNLWDLKFKLYGASAEGYWRGAFPGLSIESHPEMGADFELSPEEKQQHKDQIELYMNSMQRYLNLMGMTARSLEQQVSDPTPHIQVQLTAISIALTVPMRIFTGDDQGVKAGDQADKKWNDRVHSRQCKHATPNVIVPVVDRLIMMDVLPEPEQYYVEWLDLNALSDSDKAQIALNRTQALGIYMDKGIEALIDPMDFLTRELGYKRDEAVAILQAVMDHLEKSHPDTDAEIMPGHAVPEPLPEPDMPSPVKLKDGERLIQPKLPPKPGMAGKGTGGRVKPGQGLPDNRNRPKAVKPNLPTVRKSLYNRLFSGWFNKSRNDE